MKLRSIASISMIAGAVVSLVAIRAAAQVQVPAREIAMPRTPDGKPDFSGLWQVMNSGAWDVQDHQARKDGPAGIGVVDGNGIPYQPSAAGKKRDNLGN